MPLIKYFGFVGSALALLLIASGWCFPQPSEAPGGVTDRPVIRIASAEPLPERVIINTNLPTIVSPPSGLEFVERWPQATVADANPVLVAKPATPAPVGDVSTKQNFAKRKASKKTVVHRAVSKTGAEPTRNDKAPTTSPATGLSLLDLLKEGLGRTQAKLMAGVEPLTALISKPRAEIQR